MRALQYLAEQEPGKYVLAKEVSHETAVPPAYLAKIFQDLVRHSILDSRRGAAGGFALKRKPEAITLLQIMEVIDDPKPFKMCVMGLDRCSDKNACPLHQTWNDARQKILQKMQGCSLASLTKKIGKSNYRDTKRSRLNFSLKLSRGEHPPKA